MGPLYNEGKRVFHTELSGRNDELELKVISTKQINGQRKEVLKGSWSLVGTTVGYYTYNLECTATVFDSPKRVDDFTAPKQ
jgi:hypothetical protein